MTQDKSKEREARDIIKKLLKYGEMCGEDQNTSLHARAEQFVKICTHLDKDGEPDVMLAGDSHEEAYWECAKCGEALDPDGYKLENPATEWLSKEAENAELRAG